MVRLVRKKLLASTAAAPVMINEYLFNGILVYHATLLL